MSKTLKAGLILAFCVANGTVRAQKPVERGTNGQNTRIEVAFPDTKFTDALTKLVEAITATIPNAATHSSNALSTTRSEVVISDPKVSEALGKWLDNLAAAKPPKETWLEKALPTLAATLCGGLITAFVSLAGLRMGANRDAARDKETTSREEALARLRADLEKQKAEFAQRVDADLAKLRATLERDRDAANAQQATRLEELRATLEIAQTILKARQDRLQKFHAPLRALLQQSRGVADKLCYHVYLLARSRKWPNAGAPDAREYAFLANSEADANPDHGIHPPPADDKERRLRVRDNNKWVTFRTLDYMPWLLKNRDCKVLVDQIMSIGQKMSQIISQYSGLAAEEKGQTSPLLGEYLAHFAVLEATYKNPPEEPYSPESQKVGYYPRGFDKFMEAGYVSAQKAAEEYESLAQAILTRWTNEGLAPATPK